MTVTDLGEWIRMIDLPDSVERKDKLISDLSRLACRVGGRRRGVSIGSGVGQIPMYVLALPLRDLISFSAQFLISGMVTGIGYRLLERFIKMMHAKLLMWSRKQRLAEPVTGYTEAWGTVTDGNSEGEGDKTKMWKRGENWEDPESGPWLAS